MTNMFRRGIRAIQRDGSAAVLSRIGRRTRKRGDLFFQDKILGQARHISPYLYTLIYRKIYGHDRKIRELVEKNADIIKKASSKKTQRLFIDCGVNEGAILRRYRTALPGFDFLGFEIQKDVIEHARKVNPGADIRNQAVAASPGEVEVFLVGNEKKGIREGTSILQPQGRTPQLPSYTVPAIRFSDLLAERRAQGCDFIVVKMDIEGAEYQIIDDLHRVWSQTGTPLIDYLMIEFHPQRLDRPEDNARYEALLTEMGVIYSTWI